VLSPYGLDIIESCLTCETRAAPLFCCLPAQALQAFEAIKFATAYPKGAVLFVEGQAARGLFVVCKGTVKLSISATLLVKLTEPGEVLGLSATISGKPYGVTAETMQPCQINYVRRDDFMLFLKEHPETCFRVIEQLSADCHSLFHEMRSLGLSHSSEEKLAKLLVEWSLKSDQWDMQKSRIKLAITQEEIAEMLGTSRETVTRVFADLRRRQIVLRQGASLVIRNKSLLRELADIHEPSNPRA